MKNLLALVILLTTVFYSNCVFSQTKGLGIGVTGGAGFSNLYGNRFINENSNPSFSFIGGLTASVPISSKFSLQSGLLLERKGRYTNLSVTDTSGNPIDSRKLTDQFYFLVLPLFLKLSLAPEDGFFIKAGPYVSRFLDYRLVSDYSGHGPMVAYPEPEYRKFEFGVSAGLGYAFPLSEYLDLSGEIRHNRGLSNLHPREASTTGPLKTHSTQLMLGIVYYVSNNSAKTAF